MVFGRVMAHSFRVFNKNPRKAVPYAQTFRVPFYAL
jgi:hypothetical protein